MHWNDVVRNLSQLYTHKNTLYQIQTAIPKHKHSYYTIKSFLVMLYGLRVQDILKNNENN